MSSETTETPHDAAAAEGLVAGRDLYGLRERWRLWQPDYQGNTGVSTEDGLYVCHVPHEVAEQIVQDHNECLRRAPQGEAGA